MQLGVPRFERQLDNALTVVVSPDTNSPVVAVNLWYDVGSAEEAVGGRGFAHLFEHLMFQGSTNVAAGEHFRLLEAAGAMPNATTSTERTNYFETVPAGALDLALWLEADRLGGLNITQQSLDSQRDVVAEEWRQRYDNQPYGDLLDTLLTQHYPDGHPYRHPTIGVMADLENATLDHVSDFFADWYAPDNAVLSLVGPLDESVFEQVNKYFGSIRPRTNPPTRRDQPAKLAPNRMVVHKDVPHDMVYLSWTAPPLTHPDYNVLGVALQILGEGITSRLYRNVVRRLDLAESAGVSNLGYHRGPSISTISARLDDSQDADAATDALLAEVERLIEAGIEQRELEKARAHFERDWLHTLSAPESRADLLSSIITEFGNLNALDTYLAELAAMTPDTVREVATNWLRTDAHYALHYLRKP